jgi:hypothetical protein
MKSPLLPSPNPLPSPISLNLNLLNLLALNILNTLNNLNNLNLPNPALEAVNTVNGNVMVLTTTSVSGVFGKKDAAPKLLSVSKLLPSISSVFKILLSDE